jgi:FkbH-like protein
MALFEVEGVGDSRFGRVLELINKTNQFNTTGKRWTYEECVTALADGTHFYAFDVTDSYTDYGLVGVIVVKDADILQIVMSCRVMGLEIEIAATADVISIMRARGVKEIYGCLVETDRNLPCRDIFSRLGFEFDDGTWVYRFHRPLDKPLHVMAITI